MMNRVSLMPDVNAGQSLRVLAAFVLGGVCAGAVAQQQPQVTLDRPDPVCPGEDWVVNCTTTPAMELQGFEIKVKRGIDTKGDWRVATDKITDYPDERDLEPQNATLTWHYPRNNQTAQFVVHRVPRAADGLEVKCLPCLIQDAHDVCGRTLSSFTEIVSDNTTLTVIQEPRIRSVTPQRLLSEAEFIRKNYTTIKHFPNPANRAEPYVLLVIDALPEPGQVPTQFNVTLINTKDNNTFSGSGANLKF